MPTFYWDDLLDWITGERNVVPIIGANLVASMPLGDGETFEQALLRRTAEKLGPGGAGLPLHAGFPAFVDAARARMGGASNGLLIPLREAHAELLRQLQPDALPEPLRLLAQITDFPLVVTTQIDARPERA